MSRVLMYPFAGAACGALTAIVIVPLIGGNADGTVGVTLVVGTVLAGSGAIAGAVLGAAEMFMTHLDRVRSSPARQTSESDTLSAHPYQESSTGAVGS